MKVWWPNDCIFSGVVNISFLSKPSLTILVKEFFLMNTLWPNDCIFGSLNSINILSTPNWITFVHRSSLSDLFIIALSCYKYILFIYMHIFACHLWMHALINLIRNCMLIPKIYISIGLAAVAVMLPPLPPPPPPPPPSAPSLPH